MSKSILIGTTRDGTEVVDLVFSRSVMQAPVNGYARSKQGMRMADFYRNGKFRGWTNFAPRPFGDTADHAMDIVSVRQCADFRQAAVLGVLDTRIGQSYQTPASSTVCSVPAEARCTWVMSAASTAWQM